MWLCLGGNYKMLGNVRSARITYTYVERYVAGECILSSAQSFPIQNIYKQQGQLSISNFYSSIAENSCSGILTDIFRKKMWIFKTSAWKFYATDTKKKGSVMTKGT